MQLDDAEDVRVAGRARQRRLHDVLHVVLHADVDAQRERRVHLPPVARALLVRAPGRGPHQRHHLHARRELAVHPVALVALRVVLRDRPALDARDFLGACEGVDDALERAVLGPRVLGPDGDQRVRHRALRAAAIPALAAVEVGEVDRDAERLGNRAAADRRLRAAVEQLPLEVLWFGIALGPDREYRLDHRIGSSPAPAQSHATMRARAWSGAEDGAGPTCSGGCDAWRSA